MKHDELEKHLGKKVQVKLFDGEVLSGELHKCDDEIFKGNENVYFFRKFYVVVNDNKMPDKMMVFRCSHVVKVYE